MKVWIRVVAGCLSVLVVSAQEQFTLTTPEAVPATSVYTLRVVTLNWETQTVTIAWRDNAGRERSESYTPSTSPTGHTLLVALNKANLSLAGQSLQARIWNQLRTSGFLKAGTVTGSPE